MRKSIRKIIVFSIILLIILGTVIWKISETIPDTFISKSRTGIESRTMEFNIEEGKIYCNDKILIKLKNTKKVNIFVHNVLEAYDYQKISNNEFIDLDVKANNQKIAIDSGDITANDGRLYFNVNEYDFLKNENEIILEIDATYKASSHIEKFDNIEILSPSWNYEKIVGYERMLPKFKKIGYIKNLIVILNSDVPIDNIISNVDEKYITKTDNSYNIKISNLGISYKSPLRIGLIGNPVSEENLLKKKIYNVEYNIENLNHKTVADDSIIQIDTSNITEGYYKQYIFSITVTAFSFCLLILSAFISNKKNTTRYNKSIENLISPILAETIIDGKTDIRNLIMTSVIEFNVRGNVKIIDNQIIQLINYNNLNEYEQEIINLIFPNGIEQTTFSDINNLFIDSNEETLRFSDAISSIRQKILEYLYSINVISKKHNTLIDIINCIAILLIVNFPIILFSTFMGLDGGVQFVYFGFVISLFFVYIYLKKKKKQITIKEQIVDMQNNKTIKEILVRAQFLILLLIFCSVLMFLNMNIRFIIIIFLSITINLLTIKINQNNILTSYGKKERIKLLELKNYINQYSLIKDRELKSVIIWDEYLAYATAFGIPSKVISQIYESWYNANITLQLISNIF